MMVVLGMVLVLVLLAALVLFVAGKETALSVTRMNGAQGLYIAEGGAVAGRATLMAYLGAYPVGPSTVDPTLTSTTASTWYANGVPASQNPLGLLDYLDIDGQRFALGAGPTTASETFQVNWGPRYLPPQAPDGRGAEHARLGLLHRVGGAVAKPDGRRVVFRRTVRDSPARARLLRGLL